ncbi:Iron-sulfur assembly protein 2 [Pleurostoma richardsiae]|uniref:Iron-sulfur assembly protein 2 n=1 Tax=Pleurostoma richardsiae TaxID=41990 RepID=A0AA38S125_9PEZI|nr:Iron-sulfur assembly protein 2 [Pleurostoma richardsiae]
MASLQCAHAPSAAKLFLQLSARTTLPAATATSPVSILDVLLPPQTARRLRPVPARSFSSMTTVTHHRITKLELSLGRIWLPAGGSPELPTFLKPAAPRHRRPFASSSSLRHTMAIYNPQKDDDGNEMMLEITPRAAKRLSQIMTKDGNPQLALRIQVESGGCHGFQYLMSLVTLPPALPQSSEVAASEGESDSAVIREDDTIFAYTPEEQGSADLTAPKIILDQPSLELLKGSKVDFTMELIGSQFKIVDNPLATSSCGCGTSFDIKI